jgi:hypothetical protein
MKLRMVLSVYAVLMLIGAVVSLAVPAQYMEFYGVVPDATAVLLLRAIGAAGVGLALMAWLARNANASPALDAMVLGLTVMSAITAVVLAMGAASGRYNALAWVPAGLYALFAVWFGIAGRASMTPKPAAGA